MLATRTKQRGGGEAIQWLAEFPERKAFHERTNHLHTSRQRFTHKRTAFRRTRHMESLCRELWRAVRPALRYRSRPSHTRGFVRGRNV